MDHPPYSLDLAPSDFHLFLHLKKHLAGKKFDDDDEVQEEIMTWFKGQAADFYDSGIQKGGEGGKYPSEKHLSSVRPLAH